MVKLPRVSLDTDLSNGLCFGCGRNNPAGLKLKFVWDGRTARADFTPGEQYQGWKGIVHGGIITCILDEAMTYAVYFRGLNCLTAKMEVKFKHPAAISQPMVITSSVLRSASRLAETVASITGPDGVLIAEARAVHFMVGKKGAEADAN